jgi:ribosomal protein S18 acetylase RimI-like enzyme
MTTGVTELRRATPADAELLAAFGERTFREAFEAGNNPDDIDAYVSVTYSVSKQHADLEDPARLTLIAEQDGAAVGYAQLRHGDVPSCVRGPAPVELLRFYVDQAWHGQGIAQVLMAEVVAAAVADGSKTLWLGVWERNPRALAFYGKCGFRDVGSHEFVMGTDHQTDRILARSLERDGAA